MPSPCPMFRHRRLHMIILHLEDQRLQSGVPGLQTDDPGRPSDVPEWWMNLEIPHVLDLPLEGLPPQNLAPGILLQSTFLHLWTLRTKSRTWTISDEEDDEGSQKKVSAAQYQLFHQAVTSSKGTFKVNPSKSRRAPRASLMDLGETEVSDRVSWLDQLSLVDTMASTARIAQGLKDEEEVEKTTQSETLNTSSSTFKHLSVK